MEPRRVCSWMFSMTRDSVRRRGERRGEQRRALSRGEKKRFTEKCVHTGGGEGSRSKWTRVESRLRKQRGLFTVCIRAIMSHPVALSFSRDWLLSIPWYCIVFSRRSRSRAADVCPFVQTHPVLLSPPDCSATQTPQ